jgi:ElaB/YqjD/DUF883 family membrane-anchored ribosome-binding protein
MENQQNAGGLQSNREKLSKDIGGMVNDTANRVKGFGARKLDGAKATFDQARTVVSDGARQYADLADDYVHANPWKALGVAAAAGLLLGFLLARR